MKFYFGGNEVDIVKLFIFVFTAHAGVSFSSTQTTLHIGRSKIKVAFSDGKIS